MPAKAVVSREGHLRDLNKEAIMENGSELDASDLMYQRFEENFLGESTPMVHTASSRRASTESGFGQQDDPYTAYLANSRSSGGNYENTQSYRGIAPTEQSVAAMLEVREDLIEKYSRISQEVSLADLFSSSIRKIEAAIKHVGGEVDPFNPAKHASGLRAIARTESLENAERVKSNTEQVYSLHRIEKITVGRAKDSKRPGLGIWISGSHEGKLFKIQGRVVAKSDFTGTEAIDFVKDENKGVMSVKSPRGGFWTDVTEDYDVAWQILPNE